MRTPVRRRRPAPQRRARQRSTKRQATAGRSLSLRNLNEVGVKGRPAAEVRYAIAGEHVDPEPVGREAMPPDSFDDHDARTRRVGDARREARGATWALDSNAVAVADAARCRVPRRQHRGGRALTPAQELRLAE